MDDIIGSLMQSHDNDQDSYTKSSYDDVVELMKFDSYYEWSNNLSDQTCPIFPMSPSTNTDVFPLDESYSIERYSSRVPRSPTHTLAEKMLRAMHFFKEWGSTSGEGILAQVWVPLKIGDYRVLTTCEQPYLLDENLCGYREVSKLYTFHAESRPGSFPGLPGRVFISKIPEWTSNVMYYNEAEFLRVQHAVDYQVRGSIALPVFDQEDDNSCEKSCCAVLEFVTTAEKPDFDLEMRNMCRALQAVNLRSALPPQLNSQSLSMNQRTALSEITNVLRVICRTHKLPLALTWIPCYNIEGPDHDTRQVHTRGKNKSTKDKYVLCIEESACYWTDKNVEGFVHACIGHYLEEGQGIVGKALQSNHPFFESDVKEFHISEYPLVQHARKFGLNAAVAVRLRSTYTGDQDYILEFFLPFDMKDNVEQQFLLDNISCTMQRICKSLRIVSDVELLSKDSKSVLQCGEENNISPVLLSLGSLEQSFIHSSLKYSENTVPQDTYEWRKAELKADDIPEEIGSVSPIEHKRSTVEKHISLNVLQQYFSGSLKDAAKSLGVCPTTLKRICRQHGISRWPSRKINKVNRSLKKIQRVLETVEGVQGGLEIDLKTGRLVAFGSITKEVECNMSRNSVSFGSEIQNARSPSASFIKFEANGIEEECILREKQSAKHRDECTLKSLLNVSVDDSFSIITDGDDGVVEHSQLTSLRTTNSSNECGSMMSGGISSLDQKPHLKIDAHCGDRGSKITVKATYKEDTIRFKFDPVVGCFKLYDEVAKRFKLHIEEFQLKYLDDEEEWVLLVSDSDLHECFEVLNVLETRTVKFLVRYVERLGSGTSKHVY